MGLPSIDHLNGDDCGNKSEDIEFKLYQVSPVDCLGKVSY